jgi:hypothetical protein
MKKSKPKEMYSLHDQANMQTHDYSHMDAGIRDAVKTLIENGIETFQSCQGGVGHCYPVPTIEFGGGYEAGFRAFAIATTFGLKIVELRRVWSVQRGELVGPHWAMTLDSDRTKKV